MQQATTEARRRTGALGIAAAAAALAVLLGGAVVLEIARDARYGEPRASADVLYVRSPAAMKKLALSFQDVLADVYWIRAIQYYGGVKRSTDPVKQYELLH